MRILLHDYSGHAFLVQLARRLARDGHQVLHVHFPGFQTPKGALARLPDDPPGFETRGLALPGQFAKYSYFRRLGQELAYGRKLAATIHDWKPEIVFSANATLDPQHAAWRAAKRLGVPFVFWVQDINSVAIARILARKLPLLGRAIGWRYTALEAKLLRGSARAIVITEDFVPILERWGLPRARIDVLENWAPREDLPAQPRDNPWARAHGLAGGLVFLYAGTIGLKHDPGLLMAVLEPDAGIYSVPSKVLTYLCAGRPLLAAMPAENLASRILLREEAGLVVPPGDRAAFVGAAGRLAGDPALRARLARNGLAYADRSFDIAAVAKRVVAIARAALSEG